MRLAADCSHPERHLAHDPGNGSPGLAQALQDAPLRQRGKADEAKNPHAETAQRRPDLDPSSRHGRTPVRAMRHSTSIRRRLALLTLGMRTSTMPSVNAALAFSVSTAAGRPTVRAKAPLAISHR